MFLLNKINPTVFFISLSIGLFLTYISTPYPTIIYKYPTPENCDHIIYKDDSDNCYKYESKEVSCPKDKSKIKSIPVQIINE